MANLLRAGFVRLKRSPVFWLGLAVMAAWSLVGCQSTYALIKEGYVYRMDDVLFWYNLVALFLPPVFCALFLGTEYSDGTIRNKLAVGHSRPAVYLSSLIIAVTAVLAMVAVHLAIACFCGFVFLDGLAMTPSSAILLLCGDLLCSVALSALCVLGSMLIHKKSVLAVTLLMCVLVLLMVSMNVQNRLEQPEMYPMVMEMVDGEMVQRDDVPNPGYVSGAERAVWQFAADFLPTGQALQYHFGTVIHPWRLCGYSLFILLASTAGGLFAFRRKDIR